MRKLLFLFIFIITISFDTQDKTAFESGEWFKFRIHYGFVTAGFATLEVKETNFNQKPVFHVIGRGYTTGVSRFFFKVEDLYESYFDKTTGNPYKFVRKIDEGGYTKNQEGFFNQNTHRVLVKDYKHKKENTFSFPEGTQDIVSTFYYLRNYPGIDKMKVGESVEVDMFFDNETTKFKLKYLGNENITTKFGKVSAMVFRPIVQSGRVFKEKESMTLWISNDQNKVPLRIQADLVVGAIKADLDAYRGIKYPLKVK